MTRLLTYRSLFTSIRIHFICHGNRCTLVYQSCPSAHLEKRTSDRLGRSDYLNRTPVRLRTRASMRAISLRGDDASIRVLVLDLRSKWRFLNRVPYLIKVCIMMNVLEPPFEIALRRPDQKYTSKSGSSPRPVHESGGS